MIDFEHRFALVEMDRQPELVQGNELVRELQELEAKRHQKINTLEQARLDAIARLAMADSYTNPENARRIEKVQQKQIESIKSRQPEFLAGNSNTIEDARTLQQIEAARHQKIDTYEQSRLDMIARLAMTDNEKAGKAKQIQKQSILSKTGDLMGATLASRQFNQNSSSKSNPNSNTYDNNNNDIQGTKSREEKLIDSSVLGARTDYSQFDGAEPEKLIRKLNQDMNNLHDKYVVSLKQMEEKYLNKIENLQLKIKSDKALLRSKDEQIAQLTKDNAKQVKALTKSKFNLIKATSREIDSLRKQIKMYHKGEIDKR